MLLEVDSRTQRNIWVEFVVGSLLCSERVFLRVLRFPPLLKTNISKFQFDPGCSHVSYIPHVAELKNSFDLIDLI